MGSLYADHQTKQFFTHGRTPMSEDLVALLETFSLKRGESVHQVGMFTPYVLRVSDLIYLICIMSGKTDLVNCEELTYAVFRIDCANQLDSPDTSCPRVNL